MKTTNGNGSAGLVVRPALATNGHGRHPDLAAIDARLSELTEDGDSGALHEVSKQAAAHQEYEKRNQAKAAADYYGRIKVRAEACLGLMDIESCLRVCHGPGPVPNISAELRQAWRVLGMALALGRLDEVFERVSEGLGITTTSVVREVGALRLTYLDHRPLRKRYQSLPFHGRAQMVAARADLPVEVVRRFLAARSQGKHRARLSTPVAIRLAKALDVPLASLKPRGGHRVPSRRRPMPKQRRLVGGRLDETYSLIRKALQELDRAGGQSDKWGTLAAWEHLYAAEEIVGKALKRAAGPG